MFERGAKQILVVDDDPTILEVLKEFLNSRGFVVDAAKSWKDALILWATTSYGLVITDLAFLDSGDYVNPVSLLRALDKNIPILVITGFGQETAREVLDGGANGVLLKPFELPKVLEVINAML
jgi:DNA-binding response OmpR family regulator